MIHDLFLYDWHTHAKETGEYFHGLTHARRALRNAQRHFHLNSTEMDIIQNHMWPVTLLHIPHTKEGWIITLTDKYCGLLETITVIVSSSFDLFSIKILCQKLSAILSEDRSDSGFIPV